MKSAQRTETNMSKLASVTVLYGRKVQPAPYESADAQVSLTMTFDPEETTNTDDQIAATMATAIQHVSAALNLKPGAKKQTTSKPATKANLDTGGELPPAEAAANDNAPAQEQKPATVSKSNKKAPAREQSDDPFADAAPAAVAPKEEPAAAAVTRGDINKGIAGAQARMKAKGQTDGSVVIKKLIAGYVVGKDNPLLADLPETSFGDFLSDLEKLGR